MKSQRGGANKTIKAVETGNKRLLVIATVLTALVAFIAAKFFWKIPFIGQENQVGGEQSSLGISEPLFDAPFRLNGPGQYGAGVEVPVELKARAAEVFKIHQFNLVASDLIGVNRTLPDYRFDECRRKKYPRDLPDTSVIIVFHNEAWSTLMRTIFSIIDRTPSRLLREIILIDDASTFGHLFEKLDKAIAQLPAKIVLERMPERSGLVKSRLRGAELANGDVLTFLDSHIECTIGWLEPLLAEVKRNHRVAACPLIDVIMEDTFTYRTVPDGTAAGFNWKMLFAWKYLSDEEEIERAKDRSIPLRSPVMAGGLYAIDRKFFFEIGAYDPGFIVWGGENLEMSFRMWMCGGEILIITCSRVGHVFRKVTPYEWPGGVTHVLSVNALRTAHVWLDEYKGWFIKNTPNASQVPYGDVTERTNLRKKLGCKSFRWYLENIYPESPLPLEFKSLGYVRSFDGKRCLHTFENEPDPKADLAGCNYQGNSQLFALTSNNQLMGNARLCVTNQNQRVTFAPCTPPGDLNDAQRWSYDPDTKHLVHLSTGLCMDVPKGYAVILSKCDNVRTQQWDVQDFHSSTTGN